MKVAVLSLTRDRLEYTKHCFGTLLEHAGCDFDWYITDQGSQDGSAEWLRANTDATVYEYPVNVGIVPALNRMLEDVVEYDYDVVVKVDNDCELVTPNTLRDVCERVVGSNVILSPWIRGLRSTPVPYRVADGISETPVIGGIFTAVPGWVYAKGYRHPLIPTLDGEDVNLCVWWRERGGVVGYLDGYEAWHYESTDGQHARFPEYFERREAERLAVTG